MNNYPILNKSVLGLVCVVRDLGWGGEEKPLATIGDSDRLDDHRDLVLDSVSFFNMDK